MTETLVQTLASTLRASILRGDFALGSRLPSEAHLAQSHRVSRTVVREALSALRADNLVEIRRGAGVFVLHAGDGSKPVPLILDIHPDLSASQIIEILELRLGVEVEAAGLAAVRCSPAQEEILILLQRQAKSEALTIASFPRLKLHLAIAKATSNESFVEFLNSIEMVSSFSGTGPPRELATDIYCEDVVGEHDAIVTAITRRDPASARSAMRNHLENAVLRFRKRLRETRDTTTRIGPAPK